MNNQTRKRENKIETIPKQQKPKISNYFFFLSFIAFLKYNISVKAVYSKGYLQSLGEQSTIGLLVMESSVFAASVRTHCNRWSLI